MTLRNTRPSCAARCQRAALLIDVGDRITECRPAAMELLGRHSESLSGRAVAALIPGLPFAAETPGYNLAYAVFHAGDRQRMRQTALLADGPRLPVENRLGQPDDDRRSSHRAQLEAIDFPRVETDLKTTKPTGDRNDHAVKPAEATRFSIVQ